MEPGDVVGAVVSRGDMALLERRARNDIRFAIRLARLRATGGKVEVLDWANMFRFTDGNGRESLVMMRDDESCEPGWHDE